MKITLIDGPRWQQVENEGYSITHEYKIESEPTDIIQISPGTAKHSMWITTSEGEMRIEESNIITCDGASKLQFTTMLFALLSDQSYARANLILNGLRPKGACHG